MVVGEPQSFSSPGSVGRGVSARLAGHVIGVRPEGLTLPERTSAIAVAPACPGYHACTIAFTLSRHGMDTGLPVSSTTIVLGLARATASITASWPHGSDRSDRSNASPSTRTPNTIATSERLARNADSLGTYAPS